ncbi:MAG TPA: LysR substrate-binding domain-containing protein, partial [Hanamia sp.]|nr:LysR substrate-binding domain-containing protein [Hanamia sp.]
TQATLSMMIKKLEEELDVKIFDRSRQPVVPTEIGIKIIAQAKIIVQENNRLKEMVQEEQAELKGELRIGIIPTLAPYLLPLFMNSFLKKYPSVKLKISEFTTDQIIHKLEQHSLDAGLLSTPLNQTSLREEALFYEQFVVYASSGEKILKKKFVLANDIDVNRLCLLEEGHCLRSQVFNLCELRNKEQEFRQLDFETGSIETLKRIVEVDQGITILPMLALKAMTAKQKQNIRYFKAPVPVREVGLVTYRYFVKEKLIQSLKDEILTHIPAEMKSSSKKEIINI